MASTSTLERRRKRGVLAYASAVLFYIRMSLEWISFEECVQESLRHVYLQALGSSHDFDKRSTPD
jgi:hypothetical protein